MVVRQLIQINAVIASTFAAILPLADKLHVDKQSIDRVESVVVLSHWQRPHGLCTRRGGL
jgi:hypothetical protein